MFTLMLRYEASCWCPGTSHTCYCTVASDSVLKCHFREKPNHIFTFDKSVVCSFFLFLCCQNPTQLGTTIGIVGANNVFRRARSLHLSSPLFLWVAVVYSLCNYKDAEPWWNSIHDDELNELQLGHLHERDFRFEISVRLLCKF